MKSVVMSAIGLMFLSACADPRVEQAQSARQSLIGMEKEALLACAGVPARSEATENAEFLTYEVKQSYVRPRYGLGLGFGHGFGSRHGRRGGFGFSSSFFLPFDYEARAVGCTATFALKDNKVTKITYGGVSDGAVRYRQCYAVVENCLNDELAAQ